MKTLSMTTNSSNGLEAAICKKRMKNIDFESFYNQRTLKPQLPP
jgi:hypothetical protein